MLADRQRRELYDKTVKNFKSKEWKVLDEAMITSFKWDKADKVSVEDLYKKMI